MCGIAGFVGGGGPNPPLIKDMLSLLDHRGPDQRGYYQDNHATLGAARLSIVDIEGGVQPIENESRGLVIVMNGEIFNHVELAEDLKRKGHRLRTRCDTEVVLHLFEEYGKDFVHRLNGQFAIAIWDKNERRLLLVRDRPGIRPLYFFSDSRRLVFGSEIKAIFADPTVPREFDPQGIDQIFTFWTLIGSTTCFKGINQVPPGCWVEYKEGELRSGRYWDYPLPEDDCSPEDSRGEQYYREALIDQLTRSVRLRLRADVTVGSYLSGGIDSSVVAHLAQKEKRGGLKTYAVEFTDELLDESRYQRIVAAHLKTDHQSIRCRPSDIGEVFRKVIWHCEQLVFRTAPSPLYRLAGLVHEDDVKVVLTGEGSDEVLWGYDLYKEAVIRRFWARDPKSKMRPILFKRLYGHHPAFRNPRYFNMLIDFFRQDLTCTGDPFYSHLTRWQNSTSQKGYYSEDFRKLLDSYDAVDHLRRLLPEDFSGYGFNGKAQYLECQTLLPGYLLSSQGDRMSMSHSVEGRYPYLDHEFIEFCARLPARYKLRVLHDKYLLRTAFRSELPEGISGRPKHAYQAPEIQGFLIDGRLVEYVRDELSEDRIKETGVFDPSKLSQLVAKAERLNEGRGGTRNNQAFVQALSAQILYSQFIKRKPQPGPKKALDHVITDAQH